MDIAQDGSSSKVIVLRNITSFKELDVAKTNFIATISHELKTPLASSDFSLKLLEDERVGQLSNEQKELLQNLKQDNQRNAPFYPHQVIYQLLFFNTPGLM